MVSRPFPPGYDPLTGVYRGGNCVLCGLPREQEYWRPGAPVTASQSFVPELGMCHPPCVEEGKASGWLFVGRAG